MLDKPVTFDMQPFEDFLKDNDTLVRLRRYQYDELENIYNDLNETIEGYEFVTNKIQDERDYAYTELKKLERKVSRSQEDKTRSELRQEIKRLNKQINSLLVERKEIIEGLKLHASKIGVYSNDVVKKSLEEDIEQLEKYERR